MTGREKQLIRESFHSIQEVANAVSQLFYGRLFELDPSLRRMFHGDLQRQGMKLMEMLTAVVTNLDRLDTLNPLLQAMGQRHVSYGVEARHYDVMERALLWSLAQALDTAWDAEHRAAWRTVIGRVSGAMKEGAGLVAGAGRS